MPKRKTKQFILKINIIDVDQCLRACRDDGFFCNLDDHCAGGGLSCTDEDCDGSGCRIGGDSSDVDSDTAMDPPSPTVVSIASVSNSGVYAL
jgi:hypothetical protein